MVDLDISPIGQKSEKQNSEIDGMIQKQIKVIKTERIGDRRPSREHNYELSNKLPNTQEYDDQRTKRSRDGTPSIIDRAGKSQDHLTTSGIHKQQSSQFVNDVSKGTIPSMLLKQESISFLSEEMIGFGQGQNDCQTIAVLEKEANE